MKKTLMFVFGILFIFSIKGQEIKFHIDFDKKKSREVESINVNSNKLIIFESIFNDDVLNLEINENTIYNEKISTSPFDGIAHEFTAIKPKRIKIGINNQFICLVKEDFENYKYIYVSKNNNTIKINMTNHQKLYK